MPKPQKRAGHYYLGRLEREHPAIFADFKAGKYLSINEAAYAAGLKHPRTRFQELKNAWNKASAAERLEFVKWARSRPPAVTPAAATLATPKVGYPVDPERHLLPWAKARIEHITTVTRIKPGELMAGFGLSPNDPSLQLALRRATCLRPAVIAAVESWLLKNAAV